MFSSDACCFRNGQLKQFNDGEGWGKQKHFIQAKTLEKIHGNQNENKKTSTKSNPYPFIYHSSHKRYPFHIPSINDKSCPFRIPCLELCVSFDCCKSMHCFLFLHRKPFSKIAFTQTFFYFSFRSYRPLALAVNKSPAIYISLSPWPALDRLWKGNRGSVNRLSKYITKYWRSVLNTLSDAINNTFTPLRDDAHPLPWVISNPFLFVFKTLIFHIHAEKLFYWKAGNKKYKKLPYSGFNIYEYVLSSENNGTERVRPFSQFSRPSFGKIWESFHQTLF